MQRSTDFPGLRWAVILAATFWLVLAIASASFGLDPHYIDPTTHGATGDGETDDTAAFQTMFDALNENDIVDLGDPLHAGFRAYCVETYGQDWDDWGDFPQFGACRPLRRNVPQRYDRLLRKANHNARSPTLFPKGVSAVRLLARGHHRRGPRL